MDYYPREMGVSGYYSPANMDIFRFLNNQSISAPKEAWRFLPGESPGWVRLSQPPIPSVAPVTEIIARSSGWASIPDA